MLDSEKLRKVIGDTVIGFDVSSLKDTDVFTESGIDSLDHMNLLLAIDDEYGLNIPDGDVDQCTSIQAIIDYFEKK